MTIEEINRRIAESEETIKVCEMSGSAKGAELARSRIRHLEVLKKEKEDRTMIGYCRFCGQSVMVDADADATEEHLNDLATDKCRCDGAMHFAWKKRVLEEFDQDIEVMFKDGDDLKGIIAQAGAMIINQEISSVSIKVKAGKTIGVGMKDKGLHIKITEKNTMENISYG